ncbi:hypothetical protein C2845_PM15G19250, partial [Panicum miliaceum]
GSIDSGARKKKSLCQEDEHSRCCKRPRNPGPNLPEVQQDNMKHDSVFEYASYMRQMPEHKHERLKNVLIIGFCSATSMVELTCHILENASSLESLTLDTVCDEEDGDNVGRCSVRKTGTCGPLTRHMILEAHKALEAVRRFIICKVPSTVKLDVRELCGRCHYIEL